MARHKIVRCPRCTEPFPLTTQIKAGNHIECPHCNRRLRIKTSKRSLPPKAAVPEPQTNNDESSSIQTGPVGETSSPERASSEAWGAISQRLSEYATMSRQFVVDNWPTWKTWLRDGALQLWRVAAESANTSRQFVVDNWPACKASLGREASQVWQHLRGNRRDDQGKRARRQHRYLTEDEHRIAEATRDPTPIICDICDTESVRSVPVSVWTCDAAGVGESGERIAFVGLREIGGTICRRCAAKGRWTYLTIGILTPFAFVATIALFVFAVGTIAKQIGIEDGGGMLLAAAALPATFAVLVVAPFVAFSSFYVFVHRLAFNAGNTRANIHYKRGLIKEGNLSSSEWLFAALPMPTDVSGLQCVRLDRIGLLRRLWNGASNGSASLHEVQSILGVVLMIPYAVSGVLTFFLPQLAIAWAIGLFFFGSVLGFAMGCAGIVIGGVSAIIQIPLSDTVTPKKDSTETYDNRLANEDEIESFKRDAQRKTGRQIFYLLLMLAILGAIVDYFYSDSVGELFHRVGEYVRSQAT